MCAHECQPCQDVLFQSPPNSWAIRSSARRQGSAAPEHLRRARLQGGRRSGRARGLGRAGCLRGESRAAVREALRPLSGDPGRPTPSTRGLRAPGVQNGRSRGRRRRVCAAGVTGVGGRLRNHGPDSVATQAAPRHSARFIRGQRTAKERPPRGGAPAAWTARPRASGGRVSQAGRRREGPASGRGGGGGGGRGRAKGLAGFAAPSRTGPDPQATAPRPRADAGRSPPPNPRPGQRITYLFADGSPLLAPMTDSSGSPSSLWEEKAGLPVAPLNDFRPFPRRVCRGPSAGHQKKKIRISELA